MAVKNYNTSPYYDDYDSAKNFYRILFKPGVAVQARELTQLQTILQNQVARFGDHVFEEGSLVIPGNSSINTSYQYVKLASSYNSVEADNVIANLVGKEIVGISSGVRARVLQAVSSVNSDPSTIYVRYTGGNGTFSDNEVLSADANTQSPINVLTAASSATGVGSSYAIESGVIYTKGTFAAFETQSILLSKYSAADDIVIGFDITESTLTSQDDGTLLDPAQGSYNYAAPGADRYNIELTLANRATSEAEPENFIQLLKIEGGVQTFRRERADYNYLEDELARRTYDESGNYIVKPYSIKMREHLRQGENSGLYLSGDGGDSTKLVADITPGKAYVLGYEVSNLASRFVEVPKARDTQSENNGLIRTPRSSYAEVTNISYLPEFDVYSQVTLYDQLAGAGSAVGTARVKGIEFKSGTHGTDAIYYLYIFDVNMNNGETFERDVKSVSDGTFVADVSPDAASLTGTVTPAGGTVNGLGTRFDTELKVGDYVIIGGVQHRVITVTDDNTISIAPNSAITNTTVNMTRFEASVNSSATPYIYRFPHTKISIHSDEVVYARRAYTRTLSSGAQSITAGTDEVFTSWSNENYFAAITNVGTGSKTIGDIVSLDGAITLSGTPSGKVLDIDLSGDGFTDETIEIYTTLQKTNSAGDEKVKTLVEDATVDITNEAIATASSLNLAKADIYQIKSVKYSADGFGQPYNSSNTVDITANYVLNNGQNAFYYDLGSAERKEGTSNPEGPVRITFDYFTHGAGDYFSVNSYSDITYDDIPKFILDGTTYNLADCLDFRPRINDAGTGFSGTGASVSELLDFNNDVQADYNYYLGRIDKIYVNSEGTLIRKAGIPAINPSEPEIPSNGMGLFTLNLKPYTSSIEEVDVIKMGQKRYTMKDIGKIDTRVKNLEYYTSLSLLEKETESFQIRDEFGFDRFKNGFIVDQFKGHRVGNPTRADYSVSMDFTNGVLHPQQYEANVPFEESTTSEAVRSANNYMRTGNFVTLPYTHEAFAQVTVASKGVNVNPFEAITFAGGKVTLTPNRLTSRNTKSIGDIQVDDTGDYSSLASDSAVQDAYGTMYKAWLETWYGNLSPEIQQRIGFSNVDGSINISGFVDNFNEGKEVQYQLTDPADRPDIEVDEFGRVRSSVVVPFIENVSIDFVAKGLKPNTLVHAFFDGIRVTNNVTPDYTESLGALNLDGDDPADVARGFEYMNAVAGAPLHTDSLGTIRGTFIMNADDFNLTTGEKIFRISDATDNGSTGTTSASATFYVQTDFVLEATLVNDEGSPLVTPPTPPADLVPEILILDGASPSVGSPISSLTIPGTLNLGENSEYVEFWIYNNGSTESKLNIQDALGIEGNGNTNFGFDILEWNNNIDWQQEVLYGQSGVKVRLLVSRFQAGTDTATFNILSNDPNTPSKAISVTSTAVASGGSGNTAITAIDYPEANPANDTGAPGLFPAIMTGLFGRMPTATEVTEFEAYADAVGLTVADLRAADVGDATSIGTIDPATANTEAVKVWQAVRDVAETVITRNPEEANNGAAANFVGAYNSGNLETEDLLSYGSTSFTYNLIKGEDAWTNNVKAAPALTTYNGNLHSGDLTSCPASSSPNAVADPLAQSFFVDDKIQVTKVDLYFKEKSDTMPVKVQVRRTVNGYPSSTGFIEGTEVILDAASVNTSANASTATSFVFDYPVNLDPGEYALVVIADGTTEYVAWVAEVGELDVISSNVIDKQPSLGVLFKSQNASTWTADQNQDLMMTLYRAEFETGTTATVDMFTKPRSMSQSEELGLDPFEVFDGSNKMRVYHRNHGLSANSKVTFSGLPQGSYANNSIRVDYSNPAAIIDDINGIPGFGSTSSANVFTVIDASQDWYTVQLGVTVELGSGAVSAEDKVRFGGAEIKAGRQVTYDIAHIETLIDNADDVTHSVKAVNTGYTTDSAFTEFTYGQDIEFTESKIIANERNQSEATLLNGSPSLTYRVQMSTNNSKVSPIFSVDPSECRGVFARNRINNIDSNTTLSVDEIIVANSNNIAFTAETKTITFGASGDQISVAKILPGSFITVEYATGETPTNEGTYRVVSVANDGTTLTVAESLTSVASGVNIIIRNDTGFVSELAPSGGSALARYVTRKIEFINPSTSINLRIATKKPSGTDIEFYYKLQPIGDTSAIETKEFTKLDVTVPTSLNEGFIDIDQQIDDLTPFNALVFKIVLKSSNSSVTPACKDLRLIALA